jgi:hypothetical protein
MRLVEQLTAYVHAAFAGIWVQTQEPDEAEREILQHARQRQWHVARWDVAQGLRVAGQAAPAGSSDPLAPLRAAASLVQDGQTVLVLLHHYHRFLNSPEVVQHLFTQLVAGKQQRVFFIVLAPVVQIPVELEKLFVVLEHPLPDRVQLERIARELAVDSPGDWPADADLQRLLDASSGLTRYEAEGAFALSLARHSALRADVVWEIKGQTLRKNHLLRLHQGTESFDALGGLANLKDFCRRSLRPGAPVKARGTLLLGVPGTGKSCFARALGNECGRPVLLLDLGALYGSLVGATEANIRQALRVDDAMAPCVLFIDELDKALSGVGGQGDSGVSTRLFGTLLSWLADHDSDVFFVGAANDIRRLPPEFTRAERLDGLFFLDLPGADDKAGIWRMHRSAFHLPDELAVPDDTGWTGAEIRSCCRLAALLETSLVEAAKLVAPVAVTAAETVDALRTWASGRCVDAARPGLYHREAAGKSRRRVERDAGNN